MDTGFKPALHHLARVGIQLRDEVLIACVGMWLQEQAIVQPDFRLDGFRSIQPRDVALDLNGIRPRGPAFCVGQILSVYFDDFAGLILYTARALDDVAVLETNLVPWEQAEVLLW